MSGLLKKFIEQNEQIDSEVHIAQFIGHGAIVGTKPVANNLLEEFAEL